MLDTRWSIQMDTSVAGHPAAKLICKEYTFQDQEVRLKGVCYSPAPIGASFNFAPNIGDYFWDTFKAGDFTVNGWDALWSRDLPRLAAMGVNCIRLYSMMSHHLMSDGTIPTPGSKEFENNRRTHKKFLDTCSSNNIYVLVGLPLPSCMLWKEQFDDPTNQAKVKFWDVVSIETAKEVGAHPAVLGFTLFNELADVPHSLKNDGVTKGWKPEWITFFWNQVDTLSKRVKAVAPDKLVGFGLHDNPNFAGVGATNLAKLSSIDFYGVNTYQTTTMEPVFGPVPSVGVGYRGLTGSALKPVIITEWGMPATSHYEWSDPESIYEDDTTIAKAAACLDVMLPKIFAEKLCLGLFYFEYCDEWWKQSISFSRIKGWVAGHPDYKEWIDKIPAKLRIDGGLFDCIYLRRGGDKNPDMPNGYRDESAFGLYSVVRGQSVPKINEPYGPPSPQSIGPSLPVDTQTPRAKMIETLKNCYAVVPK